MLVGRHLLHPAAPGSCWCSPAGSRPPAWGSTGYADSLDLRGMGTEAMTS